MSQDREFQLKLLRGYVNDSHTSIGKMAVIWALHKKFNSQSSFNVPCKMLELKLAEAKQWENISRWLKSVMKT